MTYEKIEFMSRSAMSNKKPEADAIVISISNPGGEHLEIKEGYKDKLFLQFDNIDYLINGCIRFSWSHAEEIKAFVSKYENDAKTIYVNCLQGQSRSAGVARFFSHYYNIPLHQDTSEKLFWICEVLSTVYDWEYDE